MPPKATKQAVDTHKKAAKALKATMETTYDAKPPAGKKTEALKKAVALPKVDEAPTADVPIDADTGTVYHLACTSKDIADRFIFVGDPGRVPLVAARFDKDSVSFSGVHREIAIITGTYKGVPVTALSTGMGTDNCEIVMNEIHVLKEYDHHSRAWAKKPAPVKIIRVGTCGSPADLEPGTLAVSLYGIGMDNTCKYYAHKQTDATTIALDKIANQTGLGKVGVYAARGSKKVAQAILDSFAKHAEVKQRRAIACGITASASGFYCCQGREVGRLAGHLAVPTMIDDLHHLRLPLKTAEDKKLAGGAEARVVNIEMENSAICYLSEMLGYDASAVCSIIAIRTPGRKSFAPPDQCVSAIADSITVALDALVAI